MKRIYEYRLLQSVIGASRVRTLQLVDMICKPHVKKTMWPADCTVGECDQNLWRLHKIFFGVCFYSIWHETRDEYSLSAMILYFKNSNIHGNNNVDIYT